MQRKDRGGAPQCKFEYWGHEITQKSRCRRSVQLRLDHQRDELGGQFCAEHLQHFVLKGRYGRARRQG